jgi:maltose O-acetyltransferase
MNRLLTVISDYVSHLLCSIQMSSLVPIFIRRHLLKILGIKVGKKCYIYRSVFINGSSITIGDYCAIGSNSYLDGTGPLIIGERVHLGYGVTILTGTHSIMPSIYRRDRGQNLKLRTEISRGCWLGSKSTILPGIYIGEGCVIAAGAVVNKDCEPNGLYAGIPATRIKELTVTTHRPFYRGMEI